MNSRARKGGVALGVGERTGGANLSSIDRVRAGTTSKVKECVRGVLRCGWRYSARIHLLL